MGRNTTRSVAGHIVQALLVAVTVVLVVIGAELLHFGILFLAAVWHGLVARPAIRIIDRKLED